MTYVKKAIKEAVEKGDYKGGGELSLSILLKLPEYAKSQIWLDLLFWSALGKARGWTKQYRWTVEEIGSGIEIGFDASEVRFQWTRFINDLASGGDTESFFAEMLK